jgi:hypothetical protein
VTTPLAPRVARALDLAIGERSAPTTREFATSSTSPPRHPGPSAPPTRLRSSPPPNRPHLIRTSTKSPATRRRCQPRRSGGVRRGGRPGRPAALRSCRRGDTNPKYTRPLGDLAGCGLSASCPASLPELPRDYSRNYSRNYSPVATSSERSVTAKNSPNAQAGSAGFSIGRSGQRMGGRSALREGTTT